MKCSYCNGRAYKAKYRYASTMERVFRKDDLLEWTCSGCDGMYAWHLKRQKIRKERMKDSMVMA